MKLITKPGTFHPGGEILLHPGVSISWKALSKNSVPELPQGIPLSIDVSLDENILLSGEHGIVWATYDLRQAEILLNALLAQNIASAIGKIELDNSTLLLIKVELREDISEAMDYIWRGSGGLRLKPDWTYADGEPNTSFEKWLNE